MKSYATFLAGFAALLAFIVAILFINPPANQCANYLLGFGAWVTSMLPPQFWWPIAPFLAVGISAALLVFLVVFVVSWRLEIWAAGLASRISAEALNAQGGISVEQEMRKLIKRFGRR